MPGVPDRHSLKQTAICTYEVLCLGPHLPHAVVHAPRPPVPCLGFSSREEECGQVLQPHGCNFFCFVLSMAALLRHRQFDIKIVGHQQHRPMGALANGRDDALDGCNIVGVDMEYDNKPKSFTKIKLKSRHVWPMQLDSLGLKVVRVPVEYSHYPAMPDQYV